MTTLTIRNLNKDTKAKLRLMAAEHGHSMEEEARRILDRAVSQADKRGLGTEIADIFAAIGGVDLSLPPRSQARSLTLFDEVEACTS